MNAMLDWIKSWTLDGKLAILLFVLFGCFLLFAALRLVKWADIIITKSRFSGGFIGGSAIAVITSMPELITEIVQSSAGHPENGMGDDIGSNAFSAFLIGVGAIISFKFLFLNNLKIWTKITIAASTIVSIILGILLFFNKDINLGKTGTLVIGIIPLSLFVFFLITNVLAYKFADHDDEHDLDTQEVSKTSLKMALFKFGIAAIFLVGFSVLVNVSVNAFQDGLKIPSESAGGVFLAITTSLPEIVAFFAFIKKRQPAAGIASLTGSHFFNLGISFFGDLAYSKEASFNNPQMSHNYPLAFMTAAMLGLLVLHFVLSKRFKIFNNRYIYLAIPSLVVVTYVIGWIFILIY